MARISTLALVATLTPMVDVSVYNVTNKLAVANAGANNGDLIEVFTVGRNARCVGADVNAKGTLGAGCTVKLQRYRPSDTTTSDLTIATTAGGPSLVTGATIGPQDILAGDIIQLLVGGANVGAAAAIEVDVRLQH
jgi:hypothetical protein